MSTEMTRIEYWPKTFKTEHEYSLIIFALSNNHNVLSQGELEAYVWIVGKLSNIVNIFMFSNSIQKGQKMNPRKETHNLS